MTFDEMRKKALAEVCYLPEEVVDHGGVGCFGDHSVKLTVNAGFE